MDQMGKQHSPNCIYFCPTQWSGQEKIICKRGVRQGDPHSPLLYVITADLLQSIINAAWSNGELSLPINHAYGQDYPIIQYADDTIFLLQDDIESAHNLKFILCLFEQMSGLKINFHKSELFLFGEAINKNDEYAKKIFQV